MTTSAARPDYDVSKMIARTREADKAKGRGEYQFDRPLSEGQPATGRPHDRVSEPTARAHAVDQTTSDPRTTAKLARMIFDRFGGSFETGAAAWSRLHFTPTTADEFEALLGKTTGVDFLRARRMGGVDRSKSALWPGMGTYAFASIERLPADPDGSWMALLRKEAAEYGLDVRVHEGNIYFVWQIF